MEHSVYHSILRIAALTLAFVLLFDSGMVSPLTQELSLHTRQYLANAVGIYASVEPNEINTLTAEISQRQRELDAREQELQERELRTGVGNSTAVSGISTYILSILLFIILVLIVLNYILDFARQRKMLVIQK